MSKTKNDWTSFEFKTGFIGMNYYPDWTEPYWPRPDEKMEEKENGNEM